MKRPVDLLIVRTRGWIAVQRRGHLGLAGRELAKLLLADPLGL